jgi:protein associated with RNAse G/E
MVILRTMGINGRECNMQLDFRVESQSYDQVVRGTWRGCWLDANTQLTDEPVAEAASDCVRLWLPAGTLMNWSTGTRPLRYNCLQYFWPERWYTLSAMYDGRTLLHTYVFIIQPATFEVDGLSYVDLDLRMLVKPDLSYEVLTQAEFEQLGEALNYNEETRIGALMAMDTLTNAIRLGVGLFATIPHTLRQTDFHLATCKE